MTAPTIPLAPTLRFRRFVWPGFVLGTVGAIALCFPLGLGLGGVGLVFVLLFGALLAVEQLDPADPAASFWRDPQRWHDVAHNVLGSFGGEVIGNLLVVAGAAALSFVLPDAMRIWPVAWPLFAQVVLLVVVADALEYARHRAHHRVPLLWRVHALHHDADRLHVAKSSRNHVLDILSRFVVVYAPLALVGAPPWLLPVYAAAILVFGPISHANLDLPVPAWLHRVVSTPQVHAIHHARAPELAGANFSPVFTVWDQCFGTFRRPEPGALRPAPGIDGERWPEDFRGQLLAPFRGPELD